MIRLERNAKLTEILAYIKEHIDLGDYDSAANHLRKICEHMAQRLIIEVGLWDKACTGRDGKKYPTPSYSRCLNLLRGCDTLDKTIYSRQIYNEVYRPVQEWGNYGSHEIAAVEDYKVTFAYESVSRYITTFLSRFPDAGRHGVLPIPRSTTKRQDINSSASIRRVNAAQNASSKTVPQRSNTSVPRLGRLALGQTTRNATPNGFTSSQPNSQISVAYFLNLSKAARLSAFRSLNVEEQATLFHRLVEEKRGEVVLDIALGVSLDEWIDLALLLSPVDRESAMSELGKITGTDTT